MKIKQNGMLLCPFHICNTPFHKIKYLDDDVAFIFQRILKSNLHYVHIYLCGCAAYESQVVMGEFN